MKYSGWDFIDNMVQTCDELEICLQGIASADDLRNSVVKRRAVVMCLLDLGELFTGLSDKEKDLFQCDHWHRVIGFRNRSAHGYHAMDFDQVYSIAVNRVPPLHQFLRQQQQRLNQEEYIEK